MNKSIFEQDIKTRKICFLVVVVGVVLYNFPPPISFVGCWLMGAGLSLGFYINSAIKRAKSLMLEGVLLSDDGEEAKINIEGKIYIIPSKRLEIPKSDATVFHCTVRVVPPPTKQKPTKKISN